MKNKSNLSRYLIALAVFVILNPFICYILKQLNKNASKIANMNADMIAYISLDVLSNVLVAVFISVGVFLIYKIMKYKNLVINIIIVVFLLVCSIIIPFIGNAYIWIMSDMSYFFTNFTILFAVSVLSWIYINSRDKNNHKAENDWITTYNYIRQC